MTMLSDGVVMASGTPGDPGDGAAVDTVERHAEPGREARRDVLDLDRRPGLGRETGRAHEHETVGPVIARAPVAIGGVDRADLRGGDRLDRRVADPVDEKIGHDVARRAAVVAVA